MSDSKIKVFAITPQVPNFIRTTMGPVAIERFDDKELRQIGKDWTVALISLAQKRRKKPRNP